MEFSIVLETGLLAKQLQLSDKQIRHAMDLMDSGYSIPFLAIYRREQTGGLGEEELRAVRDAVHALRHLDERKLTVLRTVHGQGKLAPELEQRIRSAQSIRELEDLYLPFKKTKRSKGTHQRRELLSPVVTAVLEATSPLDFGPIIAPLLGESGFSSELEALEELHQLLQEHFVCTSEVRGKARDFIRSRAVLFTRHAPIEEVAEEGHAGGTEMHGPHGPPEHEPEEEPPTAESHDSLDVTRNDSIPIPEHGDGSVPEIRDVEKDDLEAGQEDDLAAEEAEDTEQAEGSPGDSPEKEAGKEDNKQSRLKAIVSIARQRRLQRREARKKRRSRLEGSFKPYLQFRRHVHKIAPLEWLAIDYGERVRVLDVQVEVDTEQLAKECWSVLRLQNHPHASLLRDCLNKGLAEQQASIVREVQRDAVELAEQQRLALQRRRMTQCLRQKPLHVPVLAIEPRLRREGTVVALNAKGDLLCHESLLFAGSDEVQLAAANRIAALLREHAISIVAVADGPGSRDVDQVLRKTARDLEDPPEFRVAEVSSAATNLYARGGRAAREFPNHPDQVKRTVALGRRLQDPLLELLRVDALRLGRALFGEENKSNLFNNLILDVYRSVLAEVRLDANEAEAAFFRYLPGMNPAYAQIIEQQRREMGGFASRDVIMSLSGVDETALKQAVPFLLIKQSENPLDQTGVHPERYAEAEAILNHAGIGMAGLRKVLQCEPAEPLGQIPEAVAAWRGSLAKIDVMTTSQATGVEVPAIREILHHFRQVGKNPRDAFAEAMLRSPRIDLKQLQAGDELVGTVVNLVDYGAFVELGPGTVGLLHVSRMSDGFIKSPREVVEEGDHVRVWVSEVDSSKGRISLSLFKPQPASTSASSEHRFERKSRDEQRAEYSGGRRPQARHDQRSAVPERERKKSRPPAPVVPITDAMKDGREPMRTFSDLMQFYQHSREDEPVGAKKGSGPKSPPNPPPPPSMPPPEEN